MNLVQKLPLGLGLACLMFMSSCSKEEAVTPEAAVSNESSNLREGGPVFVPVNHLPSTDGPTTELSAPNYWYGGATSNLTAYGGNPLKKWLQPLSEPSTGPGAFITVESNPKWPSYGKMTGSTSNYIKNLTVGKKYKFTFSVSATSIVEAYGAAPYASNAAVKLEDWANSGNAIKILELKNVDFTGKHNQWITETIEFVAPADYLHVVMISSTPWIDKNKVSYTNFHVRPNAVQQIN